MLQLALSSSYGGAFLADISRHVTGGSFSTNVHGFADLAVTLDLNPMDAYAYFTLPGPLWIKLSESGLPIWEGRVEDVTTRLDGTLDLRAFGAWRAMSDLPYTALWSTTTVDGWRAAVATDPGQSGAVAENRFSIDTNGGRLYIAPQKNNSYTATAQGRMIYFLPSNGSRGAVTFSASATVLLPTGWLAAVYAYTAAGVLVTTVWSLTGNGSTQTATISGTFSSADILVLALLWNGGGTTTYANENGDFYVKLTGIRIKTTTSASVYADEIAKAFVSFVNGVNSSQISSSTALISSPSNDLTDISYADANPADELAKLANLGDNQTPPNIYEVGAWEDQVLYFRKRGSAGRTWYIDVRALTLQRSMDGLYTSAYATYQDASGRTLRTTTSSDTSAGVSITRRQAVSAGTTTSATLAGVIRDTSLNDTKNPQPRATIGFDAVYDSTGATWPLYYVRAGDTLVIRNFPAVIGPSTPDRLRSFRLSRTSFDLKTGALSVEPETALPSLDVLVARLAAGL